MHSFPAQGATVQGTATLAGHWSQAKRETYVGGARAVYRHTVQVAREDLGVDGTDEDRITRYAQRIAENRQRRASIHSALDPALKLAAELPAQQPIPGAAALQPLTTQAPARTLSDTSPGSAARAKRDTSSAATADPAQDAERAGSPDWVQQLGPPPQKRIARERWDLELKAQRLEALQCSPTHPAPNANSPAKPSSPPHARPTGPVPPRLTLPKPGGPSTGGEALPDRPRPGLRMSARTMRACPDLANRTAKAADRSKAARRVAGSVTDPR